MSEAQILSTVCSADHVVSKITLLYREDILQQTGNQDMALAGLITSLYRAAERLNYNSVFFMHIENLKGNLDKYNLENRNIIEFLMGFILFTKAWRSNELGTAQEWLDFSKYALKSVGSNAWWCDLCYLLARWEHGLAMCSKRDKYTDHLANEYLYYDRARQHCLRYQEHYTENISYKIILCTAKMIQLKLDLPIHHKRHRFRREFALEQLRICTISVLELRQAHSLQDHLMKEASKCAVYGNEVKFYIYFGDIYLLIREL